MGDGDIKFIDNKIATGCQVSSHMKKIWKGINSCIQINVIKMVAEYGPLYFSTEDNIKRLKSNWW